MLALIFYKPAAALVYATGFLLIGRDTIPQDPLMGFAVLLLSLVVLPALMRFFTWTTGQVEAAAGGGLMGGVIGGGNGPSGPGAAGGPVLWPAGGDGREQRRIEWPRGREHRQAAALPPGRHRLVAGPPPAPPQPGPGLLAAVCRAAARRREPSRLPLRPRGPQRQPARQG